MTSSLNLSIYATALVEEPAGSDPRAVHLDEARACFSLFSKGVGGRYLQARSLAEAPGLLANPRRHFPFSDGRDVYLPPRMEAFESRADNWRVFRLYTALQAGQWEAGSFDRPRAREAGSPSGGMTWRDSGEPLAFLRYFLGRFPMPGLAADIFITVESARVAIRLARGFGGIAADLAWFLERLGPNLEPLDHQCVLWNLFFALLSPVAGTSRQGCPSEVLRVAEGAAEEGADLKTSLEVTLNLYRLFSSRFTVTAGEGGRLRLDGLDAFFSEVMPGLKGNRATLFGREAAEGEGADLVPPELGEVLSLDFYSHLIPSGVGEFLAEDALGKRLGEGEERSGARPGREAPGDQETYSGEEGVFRYPEWDYLAGAYRREWTTLHQQAAEPGDPLAARRLLGEWEELVREVTRQFRLLRLQERAWRKRLEWGEEIDIAAAVERAVALRGGLPATEKIYMEKRRVTREVSALFLLDLSASTSSQIEDGDHAGETVLQLLLASVAVMARALEQLGDRYAIFGFSGYGRHRVDFLRIKGFGEPLDEAVWGRLGGLKPLKSTRMGAAVRHAHRLLDAEASSLKLMLVLSDGYPQDFDYGEDRTDREYGLRDTAMALREAEAHQILSFNLTVDAAGHDYLRRMCPPHGYLVLKSVEDLPSELPKVYLKLRGN
ncbi:MAG: hypothetical protein H5T74_05090 [Actinobacteria bacterium]|nr:hypothetical protein [Actinomycetota bacterium]